MYVCVAALLHITCCTYMLILHLHSKECDLGCSVSHSTLHIALLQILLLSSKMVSARGILRYANSNYEL